MSIILLEKALCFLQYLLFKINYVSHDTTMQSSYPYWGLHHEGSFNCRSYKAMETEWHKAVIEKSSDPNTLWYKKPSG